jgi:hypothetical protein
VPAIVRREVSLVMPAPTEEQFIYLSGEYDYEHAVRDLFITSNHLRRLGHLIHVIAVFDVLRRRPEAAARLTLGAV